MKARDVHHTTITRETSPPRARGLTLTESLVSIVLLGTMIVGALHMLSATARTRQHHAHWSQGSALAHELMDEILQCHYAEPANAEQVLDDGAGGTQVVLSPTVTPVFGPETGEDVGTRLNFDDIDDYHFWGGDPPEDKQGVDLPGCEGWERKVTVWYADPATFAVSGVDTGVKRIEVKVVMPTGWIMQFEAVRFRNGANHQTVLRETTTVGWVGVRLQVGPAGTALTSGVSALNLMPIEKP